MSDAGDVSVAKGMRAGARWLVAYGLLMLVLGVVSVVTPLATALVIAVLLGWLFLGAGALALVHAFSTRGTGGFGLKLLNAVLYFIGGAFLLVQPLRAAVTLTLLVGLMFLLRGASGIGLSLQLKGERGSGWLLIGGAVTALLGVLILTRWPSSAAWAIGTLVGIHLISAGWARIAMGSVVREAAAAETAAEDNQG